MTDAKNIAHSLYSTLHVIAHHLLAKQVRRVENAMSTPQGIRGRGIVRARCQN
jgi:hypothetical protein